MNNMNLFSTEEEIVGIEVKRLPSGHQAEITVVSNKGICKLLAENTTARFHNSRDLPGLELYLRNVPESQVEIVKDVEGYIQFPVKMIPTAGLFKGQKLQSYDHGLSVTLCKPYHKGWDREKTTHTYEFGKYQLLIDIGALNALIISVINMETGEKNKY